MSQVTSDISNNRKILEAEPNDVTPFENDCDFLEVQHSIGTTSSRVVKLKARNSKDDVSTLRISRPEAITNSRDQITESSRSLLPHTCSPKNFIQTGTLATTENSASQRTFETSEDWDPAPLSTGPKYKTGNLNFGEKQDPRKILTSPDWHHQTISQARTPLSNTPVCRTGNKFDSSLRFCERKERVPSKFSGPPIWNAVNRPHATEPPPEEDMDAKPSRRNEYRRIDRVLREGILPSQELIDDYEREYGEQIPAQLQNRIDSLRNELKAAATAEKKRKAQAKRETPRKTPRINTASSPALRSDYLTESPVHSLIEGEGEYDTFPDKVSSSSPYSVGQLGKLPQHTAGGDKNRPVSIEDDRPLDFTRGVQMKGGKETIVKMEQITETRALPEMTHTAVTTQAFKIGAKTVGIANKLFEDLSEAVTVLKHTRMLTGSGTADEVIRNFERSNYTHKLEKPRFFFLGKSNDTHPHFMVNGAPSPSRFIPMFTIPMTENDEAMLKVHQQNVLKDSALFQASATGGHNPITWYSSQETWKPETKVIAVTEDEYNYLVEARKARYIDLTNEGETGARDGTKADPSLGPAASATQNLPKRMLANTHAVWPKWAEQSWEHQRVMINKAKHVAAEWNKDQRERVEIANTLLPRDKQLKFESVEWERFMRVTAKPKDPVRSMEYLEEAANVWDSEIENDTVLLGPGPPISKKEQIPSPPPQVQNSTTTVSSGAVVVVVPPNQLGAPLDRSGVPSNQLGAPLDRSGVPSNQLGAPLDRSGVPSNQLGAPLDRSGVPSSQTIDPTQVQNFETVAPITGQQMLPPRRVNNELLPIAQPKPIHSQNWDGEQRSQGYGNDAMESSYPKLNRSYTSSPQFRTSSSGLMQYMRTHGLMHSNDMQIPRHSSASPMLNRGHSSQQLRTPDPSAGGPDLNGSSLMYHQDLQQQYAAQRFPQQQFPQQQFPQHQFPQHQFPQHQFPQHHAHQGQFLRHDTHSIQPEYSAPAPLPFVTMAQVQNSTQGLVQTPDHPGDECLGEGARENQTGFWEEQK